MTRVARILLALLPCCAVVAGCNWDDAAAPIPTADAILSVAANVASPAAAEVKGRPTISGAPRKSVLVGEQFEFSPIASEPNGLPLRFSIANRPGWMQFDTSTGRLSGLPAQQHVGSYQGVRISVSNGRVSAALPEFSLQVADTQGGQVTVYWDPPTDNVDGSALTDVAGYRIYYGPGPDRLTTRLEVSNPGVTSAVVDNLSTATWYFAVAAYTRADVEGELSDIVPYAIL